ncbi:MAG TPA: sulfotransferase [Steroidobacteraceae bacterium]|jgi:tetratricopeptide (TPR) repeat protein|nr:sulfotransferase [Steroidobacteraceae bacterium]
MSTAPDPDTLAELALQDMHNNQLAAAEDKCLRVLNANRQHVGALTVLGLILHCRARHEDAVRVFNALTLLQPNNLQHWSNLGTALRPTRRYDQALAAHARAMQLGPVSAPLLYNMALVQMDRLDYNAAYASLMQARDLAPADAGICCLYAQCCYDVGLFEEALAALQDWPKLQGLNLEVTAQIAHLLIIMGESRRAQAALRQICTPMPGGALASLAAVRLLERINRLDDARAALESFKRSAQTTKPDPELLMLEAALAARADDHETARARLSLALEGHNDFPRRYHLLFPLAAAQDALGRFDEAYATLVEAHRSQVVYLQAVTGRNPADESATMAVALQGCDPEDVRIWEEEDAPTTQASPIFIVAFPRSGTTLLEQMLDAHPQVKSMDEQPFIKKAHDEVTELGLRYPAELGRLSAAQRQSIRAHYWERVRAKVELPPGNRLVDKNPLNLLRLPLIRRLFPHARIVLAIRHPCDTLLSCFAQQFRAPDLALMCRDLGELAGHYRRAFDFWYAQWPLLRPASYELKYEELVADFEHEVRRLSEFLQLPWHDAMLAPGEHARAKGYISTPSYAQVIEPINSRSVGHWQAYRKHFKEVLPTVLPYLERWGYTT